MINFPAIIFHAFSKCFWRAWCKLRIEFEVCEVMMKEILIMGCLLSRQTTALMPGSKKTKEMFLRNIEFTLNFSRETKNFLLVFLFRRNFFFFTIRLSQKRRKFSHQLIYYFFFCNFLFYLCLLKINFSLFWNQLLAERGNQKESFPIGFPCATNNFT